MDAVLGAPGTSRKMVWISYIVSAIPVLMLLLSGVMKLIPSPQLSKGFEDLGWPIGHATLLAVIELSCVVIYLIPRTAVLGAILIAAYLGGATATHIRISDYSEFFIPIVLGILAWLGLWLRDPRLRQLLPLRS